MSKKVPKIEEIYPGEFPDGFVLTPLDWYTPKEIVDRAELEAEIRGEKRLIRPISTMDVEFLNNSIVRDVRGGRMSLVKNYQCGLKCPGCFSDDDIYGDSEKLMLWEEIMDVLRDAKKIGLHSIKFLGHGEFLQNPDAFDILDALGELDLKFSIFTKGVEVAVDKLAEMFHGRKGIRTGEDLAKRLSEYNNVRILQHFLSFDEKRQDAASGSKGVTRFYDIYENMGFDQKRRGVPNYTNLRNRAVEIWGKYFINPDRSIKECGQKLTLVATPFEPEQIDEASEMYMWAARRDIPLVIAPTMESGRGRNLKKAELNKGDAYFDGIIDVYVDVYSAAIDSGITTLERIRDDGLSAYIGTSPCNQVANGLMMRLNGQIKMCPGPDKDNHGAVYGNVHERTLAELWIESPNYQLGRLTNNWCTAKTSVLPGDLRPKIMEKLERKY